MLSAVYRLVRGFVSHFRSHSQSATVSVASFSLTGGQAFSPEGEGVLMSVYVLETYVRPRLCTPLLCMWSLLGSELEQLRSWALWKHRLILLRLQRTLKNNGGVWRGHINRWVIRLLQCPRHTHTLYTSHPAHTNTIHSQTGRHRLSGIFERKIACCFSWPSFRNNINSTLMQAERLVPNCLSSTIKVMKRERKSEGERERECIRHRHITISKHNFNKCFIMSPVSEMWLSKRPWSSATPCSVRSSACVVGYVIFR